jgi:nucleotide-binding universal stress UspA family protein
MSGIVVGIDGSGHSQRALAWAMREAALRQVPLTVVAAHSAAVGYFGTISYPEDQVVTQRAREAARKETEEALERLGEPVPPQVNIQAVTGTPAEELLLAARDADLLVVGSRGTGGFTRRVMGPVSSQVACHAQCPVVIIPPANRQRVTSGSRVTWPDWNL